eukprot:COSAG06_NODE_6221_length_3038_cov_24.719633_2_plen_244_part_00
MARRPRPRSPSRVPSRDPWDAAVGPRFRPEAGASLPPRRRREPAPEPQPAPAPNAAAAAAAAPPPPAPAPAAADVQLLKMPQPEPEPEPEPHQQPHQPHQQPSPAPTAAVHVPAAPAPAAAPPQAAAGATLAAAVTTPLDQELLALLAKEVTLDGGVTELSALPGYNPAIRWGSVAFNSWKFSLVHLRSVWRLLCRAEAEAHHASALPCPALSAGPASAAVRHGGSLSVATLSLRVQCSVISV